MKLKVLYFFVLTTLIASCGNTKLDFNEKVEGKYWKLILLKEDKIKMQENQEREIHFILNAENKEIKGFSGCNHFTGFYKLNNSRKKISFSDFSNISITCSIKEEEKFLEILNQAFQFYLNSDRLFLKDQENNVLAVFEAVYF